MGQQTQLDLRVIRNQELESRRCNEGAPDRFPTLRADRDVLQIRVGGGQPPRGRPHLVEAGVDAAGLGVDVGRQRIDVGGLEFRELPVLHQKLRHLVTHRGELLEHVDIRRRARLGLLEHWELQVPEQHGAQLGCGVQVELHSRRRVEPPLDRRERHGKFP